MKTHYKLMALTVLILISSLVNGCGDGSGSGSSSASISQSSPANVISAPTGVIATSGINKVSLTWNPVAGADSYNVYWSTNPGVTPATGTKENVVACNFQHVGLFVSQTYFYVVTAVNSNGESAASSQAATVAATDSANLYIKYCQECHGPITATTIMGGTPDKITAAIANNIGGMGKLSALTSDQITIISLQLPCH